MVQTVWLLVYLRFTVESVRGSLQRRGAEAGDASDDLLGLDL